MGLRSYLFGCASRFRLLLLLTLWACDPGGQLRGAGDCPRQGCESGVSLGAVINLLSSDLSPLTVRFCRGQLCVSSGLTPATSGSATSFRCDASGPLSTSCQLTLLGSGSAKAAQLDLHFAGRLDDFADGDVYTVQVSQPAGPLLLDRTVTVTYAVTPAASSGCPAQCRSASL